MIFFKDCLVFKFKFLVYRDIVGFYVVNYFRGGNLLINRRWFGFETFIVHIPSSGSEFEVLVYKDIVGFYILKNFCVGDILIGARFGMQVIDGKE